MAGMLACLRASCSSQHFPRIQLLGCFDLIPRPLALALHPQPTHKPCRLPACCPVQVNIARCDSHELFRSVQDVRGVVVLLPRGGDFLPQPHQLSTSLRAQTDASGQPMFD